MLPEALFWNQMCCREKKENQSAPDRRRAYDDLDLDDDWAEESPFDLSCRSVSHAFHSAVFTLLYV